MTRQTGVVTLVLALASCAFGESLTFKGETDKDPLSYKVGEKMTFTVTLVDKDAKNAPVKGRRLVWQFAGDDGKASKGEAKFGRMTGWFPGWTDALGYFDTANFAKRITCPVDMTIGLGDYVCPPSGEMILYQNLKGPKKLTARQNMGHGAIYGVETKVYTYEGDLE